MSALWLGALNIKRDAAYRLYCLPVLCSGGAQVSSSHSGLASPVLTSPGQAGHRTLLQLAQERQADVQQQQRELQQAQEIAADIAQRRAQHAAMEAVIGQQQQRLQECDQLDPTHERYNSTPQLQRQQQRQQQY